MDMHMHGHQPWGLGTSQLIQSGFQSKKTIVVFSGRGGYFRHYFPTIIITSQLRYDLLNFKPSNLDDSMFGFTN
jgi:hypothetical protein